MGSDLVMTGSYDYRLVALSVLIAILASYTALDLAGRVTGARGGARFAWLSGGTVAMGIGTWAMHYTGMLAFSLPVPVQYDWPTAAMSFLASAFASLVGLFVVSRRAMGALRAWSGSIFMGGGIAALHYIAMASMRLQAMCRYSPALVTLSVLLAIGFSLISLWLTFLFRNEAAGRRLRKAASALVMGAAVSVMHYTGMASVSFTPSAIVPDVSRAVSISSLGMAGIGSVTMMVLGIALLTVLLDRLHDQRVLLDELFEQGPEAVALTSVDNQVVRVNREFTRIFGYTPQETFGRRLSELVMPDELREESERDAGMVAHGCRVDGEGVRRRKDGSRLHVAMLRVPVSLPSGQIATYEIYRDITERLRAEEALREAQAELAHVSRVTTMGELAASIAHEINQPLTAVVTNGNACLRWLAAVPPNLEEARGAVTRLIREGERASDVIRRIRAFLKKATPRTERLKVNELIRDVLALTRHEIRRHGVVLRTELAGDTPSVRGDRVQLQQVILNLIMNSLEAMTAVAEGPREIRVTSRKDESGQVLIAVEDTGVGIDAQNLDKLFDAFYTTKAHGMGMGLAISRSIVEAHGGRLWATASEGRGAVFQFTLPIATEQQHG